ncbi:Uncharacterised protein [Bordetella pertussis]|nr:Uncharacterised protein [Bordetella pertussis]
MRIRNLRGTMAMGNSSRPRAAGMRGSARRLPPETVATVATGTRSFPSAATTRVRSLPRERAAMKVRNRRRAAASRTRRRFLPSRRRRPRATVSMTRARIP